MKKKIGKYCLKDEIGHGAFAKVFKAINEETKETVAIKMIPKTKIGQDKVDIIDKEI